MNRQHIIAVFKAEYYTTTARFRVYRKQIPILFIAGILLFSYILRSIFDVLREDIEITPPSLSTFFSLLAIFSYFTIFAPLLSAQVVYDDSARSRREVALSSPVSAKSLLIGNLLSNLAFYLPFFGLIGTLILSPFMGSGQFNPILTSVLLFLVLSVIIVIGLTAGTLLSPVVYFIISKQKNEIARAAITLMVAVMMIFSLPLLKYLMDNVEQNNLGVIGLLPFTLASSLMIYILYGQELGIPPVPSILYLLLYVIIIIAIGWWKADRLYNLHEDVIHSSSANPSSRWNKILDSLTIVIPGKYRYHSRSIMRASMRDIEHISRLSIGLAVTVFMIFALSSRGLFRTAGNFPPEIEMAVIIFSLVLSSASVIFIEASSFTIQHRDMLSLIKSSPDGATKFIVAKAIQMFYFSIPIFISIILVLSSLGFIDTSNRGPLILTIIITLICLISICLAIYILNPIDNPEDISNFINLLFFYIISFILAIAPVVAIIRFGEITWIFTASYFLFSLLIAVISLYISIKALEQMNIETLSSRFSLKFTQVVKSLFIYMLVFNMIPLLSVGYLLSSGDIIGFLLFSSILSLIVPIFMWAKNIVKKPAFTLRPSQIRFLFVSLVLMLLVAILISLISPNAEALIAISPSFPIWQVIIIIMVLGISEELLFRGFFFDLSHDRLDPWENIVLTAMLFATGHVLSVISFINAFIQGLILGYSRHKTGSLLPAVLLHLSYNLIFILY
ncbi:MAG: CPBP family intramembrane metalloprotease [Candidatus Heimdallarchaeota archaeon]|nr:CPBP family intramembrane metalloprotease [Candidatus Heimdallarchaeota archaeon]